MEKAMRTRTIALAALMTIGTPAFAAPPKGNQLRGEQPHRRPAELIVASADSVRSPQPSSAMPRRPAARVTTCRCGDPQPDPEQPQP
jgi:hypothetical protein